MVRTPRFHCRGHRFDRWLGHWDPARCVVLRPEIKKNTFMFWFLCNHVPACTFTYMNIVTDYIALPQILHYQGSRAWGCDTGV